MTKQRKTNTFETLFGDLLKTLQLLDGKELTPFQSELYENTLHSAIQSTKRKKHPFPAYARYDEQAEKLEMRLEKKEDEQAYETPSVSGVE